MNSSKKPSAKKSAKSRIPKGLPGAGQYASKEKIEIIKAVEREKRQRAARERKNTKLREKRQVERTQRKSLLAQAGGALSKSALNNRTRGWASGSSSRLRVTTSYHWHAAITVTGTSAQLKQVAEMAGSGDGRVRLKKIGDDEYVAVFLPGVGAGTAKFAATAGYAGAGEGWAAKFRATGASAEYSGLVYNTVRTAEYEE